MIKPIRKMPIVASTMMLLIGYLPVAFGHEVSLSCPVAFGPVPDASGLIAYYPLDGNTADVSGNGMDAIEVNAAEPADGTTHVTAPAHPALAALVHPCTSSSSL